MPWLLSSLYVGVFFSFGFGRKCVVVGSVMEELEKMRRDLKRYGCHAYVTGV
jgi:hypothetical protein